MERIMEQEIDYSNEMVNIYFLMDYFTFKKGQQIDISQGQINIVVGDNGAGKTTFLEMFSKRNRRKKLGVYYNLNNLRKQDVVNLKAESFRASSSALVDNRRELYLSELNQLSHGQAWNIELFRFREKCSNNTFAILDEPETALSIQSQIDLCKAISDMKRKYKNFGCLIATHSLIITELIGERVIHIPSGENIPAEEYMLKNNRIMDEAREYCKI
jgi:predicted ATPase